MAADKNQGKGFCPFCGQAFTGSHDNCPFCGQDLRQYNDDLGPVLDKIQTATNIDMKSPRVRGIMAVVIALLVFAGGLVVINYYEEFKGSEPVPPYPEGYIIDLGNNEYLDLTGDFYDHRMNAVVRYDPDLSLNITIPEDYRDDFTKVMWMVQSAAYNGNPQSPFFLKITKEASEGTDICSVTWKNVTMGSFTVTASCYTADGSCTVFTGGGIHYGKYSTTYTWTYNNTVSTFDFTMSSDDVKKCITADLRSRVDAQSTSSMTQYITDGSAVMSMSEKLTSLFNKSRYTEAGYADFVLSFVQSCFLLEYDSYNYNLTDYWAYPEETILYGCGDDEDKAILYASIMKASGFKVGLIHLPETTMAAVEVDLTDSIIQTYAKTIRDIDHTYTVADTGSALGLGIMRSQYDISDSGRMMYNGEELYGRYGLETL